MDNPQHLRTQSYDAFAQDTFRIRPDLTLSLGVRYEYNTPPVDAKDRADIYEPTSGTLVPLGKNGILAWRLIAGSEQFRAAGRHRLVARGQRKPLCFARDTASTTINRHWRPAKAFISARRTLI